MSYEFTALEKRVRVLEGVVEKLLALQVDQVNDARYVLEELWAKVEVGGPAHVPQSEEELWFGED